MSEKPILFSGEMVRAILAGRKTMTRRPIKPQPVEDDGSWLWSKGKTDFAWPSLSTIRAAHDPDAYESELATCALEDDCPYGPPGTVLWVRETWWQPPAIEHDMRVQFDADLRPADRRNAERDLLPLGWRRRASIHLPRAHARLFLRVKSVRVERVQEIDYDGATAEGVFADFSEPDGHGFRSEARNFFHDLWDSLNAKRGFSWDDNPWVWVVEFERCEEPA